ncbi:MAG: hypothetical protein R8F63_09065 [Acidimicrobiales bacterium]|nr:hypothetical protein [Acidimicrobiales bacterium]
MVAVVSLLALGCSSSGDPADDSEPSEDRSPKVEDSETARQRAFEARAVPSEVVEVLEVAEQQLASVVAPESAGLVAVDSALPAGSELEVVADSWVVSDAGATVEVLVTRPGLPADRFVVVMFQDDVGEWLISSTLQLSPGADS